MNIPVTEIKWQPAWRIIPSRFPTINLFERVADPSDFETLCLIESMTNDRLREETNDAPSASSKEKVSGPGSSVIMAPFTHLNPEGSRFTDGSFGVFYASDNLNTAIKETQHHREVFLKATNEPAMELDMRVYLVDLNGKLHDIRNSKKVLTALYDTQQYQASQKFACELRNQNSYGIVYRSIRDEDGNNSAVFTPKILSNCRQERHLCYVWNGEKISTIYQKTLYT